MKRVHPKPTNSSEWFVSAQPGLNNGFLIHFQGTPMPATNSLVPMTNHHPVDIENQQTIQAAPNRYSKAATFAKLGVIAGVCAATSGLLLADLANRHNITLPVQHTPGRELLELPVNGTCPEGQIIFNKDEARSGLLKVLWISLGVCPGVVIVGAIIPCIPKIPKILACASWTTVGGATLLSGGGISTVLYGFGQLGKLEDGHCYPK